jgi:hypothetical protein
VEDKVTRHLFTQATLKMVAKISTAWENRRAYRAICAAHHELISDKKKHDESPLPFPLHLNWTAAKEHTGGGWETNNKKALIWHVKS